MPTGNNDPAEKVVGGNSSRPGGGSQQNREGNRGGGGSDRPGGGHPNNNRDIQGQGSGRPSNTTESGGGNPSSGRPSGGNPNDTPSKTEVEEFPEDGVQVVKPEGRTEAPSDKPITADTDGAAPKRQIPSFTALSGRAGRKATNEGGNDSKRATLQNVVVGTKKAWNSPLATNVRTTAVNQTVKAKDYTKRNDDPNWKPMIVGAAIGVAACIMVILVMSVTVGMPGAENRVVYAQAPTVDQDPTNTSSASTVKNANVSNLTGNNQAIGSTPSETPTPASTVTANASSSTITPLTVTTINVGTCVGQWLGAHMDNTGNLFVDRTDSDIIKNIQVYGDNRVDTLVAQGQNVTMTTDTITSGTAYTFKWRPGDPSFGTFRVCIIDRTVYFQFQ